MDIKVVRKNFMLVNVLTWFVLLVGGISSALAATYYVGGSAASDSNPGTQAAPWKTIGKASTVMAGGDIAIVSAGTYDERVTTSRSGASGSPITFKASGRVVMKGFVVNHDHITIDGFEITNVRAGTTIPINGNYCRLLNNVIKDTYSVNNEIKISGSNALIRGNRISSVATYSGDYPVMDFGGSYATVENNEIGPMNDIDVFRPFGVGHVFRNNYIHDLRTTGSAHLDILQVWGPVGAKSANIVFENNRIVNVQGQMFMTSYDQQPNIGNWDVRNNVWINVSLQGNVGIPNFRFYNNTLYNVGYGNGFALYLYNAWFSDPSNAVIKNNIFIGAGGLNVTSIGGAYTILKGSNIVTDYNFVAAGPGTGYAPLKGFNEARGINGGDPKFVNLSAADLRLQQGSPAIDKGTTLTGFNYDLNGVTRPQGAAWDMGAYEYSGTAAATTLAPPKNLRVAQ